MKQYSWEFNEDDELWGKDTYDTVEECIEAAKAENKLDGNRHTWVFVGRNIDFVPYVDAENVLEAIQEQAAEECGQIGHDWYAYDHKKQNELEELNESLSKVVIEWLEKLDIRPKCTALII